MEVDRGAISGVREVVGLVRSLGDPGEPLTSQLERDPAPAPAVSDHDAKEIPAAGRGVVGRRARRSLPARRAAEPGELVADDCDEEQPIRAGEVALTVRTGVRERNTVTLVDDGGDASTVRGHGRADRHAGQFRLARIP